MRAAADVCPACGVQSLDGARFCAHCGAELETRTGLDVRCGVCRAELPPGARFCPGCGAGVDADRAPVVGREGRKVVTALFADVVGSTTLGERLDPEDYRQVVGEAVARMVTAIEEFGGSVQDLAGDGVLGLFGVPAAHEDDAERAALAALRILEVIDQYSDEAHERFEIEGFAIRVGIETGLAVLGPVGGGGRVEFGAMGDVLNTAARLEASAEPGTALVGALTHRLVEPLFEWGSASRLQLKGKAEPVTAYPLLGSRPAAERVRAAATDARLVGRERELSLAEEALDEALAGRGGILVIEGEGGIGKSRLVRELRALFERATADGRGAWVQGRCVSYGESIPHLPLRAALREWLEGGDGDRRGTLAGRSGELLGTRAEELSPFLGALLGLPADEDRGALEGLSPEALQSRMQEAVRALLTALAARGPLVLSIDDLQWADAASLAILEGVLDSTEEAPILIVLAHRNEPRPALRRIAEIARRELSERTRTIELQPLGAGAERGLLTALVGEGTLPEALERQIVARAGGNPFFLEELIRSLIDSGALVGTPEGWRFEREAELELPQTVERVILARIDRLPPGSRDLLEVASVLGREFGSDLLEEATGPLSDPDLRELLRAEFLRETHDGPRVVYRFRHQLILEAVGRGLLRERRRELHARAADALERILGEGVEEHLGVLANHCSAAGLSGRAFDYHRRAAAAAARVSAREEAIEHLTGALAQAELMEERPDPSMLRELRLERAQLTNWAGDVDGAMKELREVISEARDSGDRVAEMNALAALGFTHKGINVEQSMGWIEEALEIAVEIGDRRGEVTALNRLALCHGNLAQLDRGLELSRRALAVAREAGDDALVALALDAMKLNLLEIGDLDELARTCEELQRILAARGDLQVLAFALMEGAYVHIARAEWEAASVRLEEAMALSRRIGDRVARPLMLEASCYLSRARGDPGRALAAGREAVALSEDRPFWKAWASATLGWTLLDLFATEEAARVLEQGLESAGLAGVLDQRIRCASHLARARHAQGRATEARELAARGEQLLAESSVPEGESFLLAADAVLSLARVRLADEDVERARALVVPLREPAGRHGWIEVVGLASLLLARCELATGDLGRAGELASEALEESGDRLPGVAWEAHALAARIAEQSRDPAGAEHHRACMREQVEAIAGRIGDPAIRETFVQNALGEPEIAAV